MPVMILALLALLTATPAWAACTAASGYSFVEALS